MHLRQREDRARHLKSEIAHWRREDEVKDQVQAEKWKLEDEEWRLKQEMMLREAYKQRENEGAEVDRRTVE